MESASGTGAAGTTAAVAEEGGGDPHLDHPLPGDVEPVAAGLRPRGDDPAQLGADEVQGGAVLGRVAGAHPLAQEAVVGLAPVAAALVVDAVAERQQAEALEPFRCAVEAGHRLGEPAERAGGEAAEDDPRLPGLAQDLVDPVRPPDPEQADDAAAADVDQVLGEQVRAQVLRPLLAAEEGDVAGLAAVGGEGAVEADDVVVGVAAGRGQEADARPLRPGQAEHVVVEQRVPGLHREAAATEGDDLAGCGLHR